MYICKLCETNLNEHSYHNLSPQTPLPPPQKKTQALVFKPIVARKLATVVNQYACIYSTCARRDIVMYSDVTSEDGCKWF